MVKTHTDLSLLLLGISSCTQAFGEMAGAMGLPQSPSLGMLIYPACALSVLSFLFGCCGCRWRGLHQMAAGTGCTEESCQFWGLGKDSHSDLSIHFLC